MDLALFSMPSRSVPKRAVRAMAIRVWRGIIKMALCSLPTPMKARVACTKQSTARSTVSRSRTMIVARPEVPLLVVTSKPKSAKMASKSSSSFSSVG